MKDRTNYYIGAGIVASGVLVLLTMKDAKLPSDPADRDTVPPPIPPMAPGEAEQRGEVVQVALAEVGNRDPARYWEAVGIDKPFPRHWCGGFALWALKAAGLAKDTNWRIGYGFCYQLPPTKNPKPGDIAYYHLPYQHHAVVIENDGTTVKTVDGNSTAGAVALNERPLKDGQYYSIQPYLTEGNIT